MGPGLVKKDIPRLYYCLLQTQIDINILEHMSLTTYDLLDRIFHFQDNALLVSAW